MFVAKQFQGQGIAKQLFNQAKNYLRLHSDVRLIEFNASAYSVPAYNRLGCFKSADAFIFNGCEFQPMAYRI
ncbi:GNAT family N-acetyltransferase [Saccharospirillum sp. MSK14-1]|uniref:GNAT family N-acetyltransferase n=1 Tax=Saccharospirillum sp. MSK14-1 TaxID=1897632 RepID=UPI000D38D00B